MPRPTDKSQLISAIRSEHDALEKSLSPLTKVQIAAVSRATKWSVKDVLSHLTEWEQMCLGWYEAGKKGKTPAVPAEGYNWAQLPALNKAILEKYRGRPAEEVIRRFRASYREILKVVQSIGERDMFTRGRYAWTGQNAMAAYFIGCTSSHYAWAAKEIRKCLK
jgi:hypothetical protein